MAEKTKKPKSVKTPRQIEIARLSEKPKDSRTQQESARLDQLRMEERRDRFLRLANNRTRKALKSINNVARMGNKATYSYNDDEAAKIMTAIQNASNAVKDAFTNNKPSSSGFTI